MHLGIVKKSKEEIGTRRRRTTPTRGKQTRKGTKGMGSIVREPMRTFVYTFECRLFTLWLNILKGLIKGLYNLISAKSSRPPIPPYCAEKPNNLLIYFSI